MTDELKPLKLCPFCGGEPAHEEGMIEQFIRCYSCNVFMRHINGDVLKVKWNNRTHDDLQDMINKLLSREIELRDKYQRALEFIRDIHGCVYGDDCQAQAREARELLKELEK